MCCAIMLYAFTPTKINFAGENYQNIEYIRNKNNKT